jgi:hypothetical protein
MIKFPYGVSDFKKLITEEYFYVDRTDRIPLIERAGNQLLFLRPRRFGKSLLLSMLENYYDVGRADEFGAIFGRLAIGQNPTPTHNQYFVLKWDFSVVNPQGEVEEIKQTLYRYLNSRIEDFAVYYRDLLSSEIEIEPTDAVASFQSLLLATQQTPYRLCLLIDEYDNFANELMMGGQRDGLERYKALLYGEGTLKALFKAIKAASAGQGLDRVFITGVSPVVLSDLTSGYNVVKIIYLHPHFNDLCGFWEAEIEQTLRQVVDVCGWPPAMAGQALAMMRTFYNGYTFSYGQQGLVYNPTLALYFMEYLQDLCQYPRQMLDSNLAMDRAKIRYISQLPNGEQLLLNLLKEERPLTISHLADRFGVEDMLTAPKDTPFMASLLYYFGVLTLGGETPFGEIILRIPNLVAKELYVERLRDLLLPDPKERDEVAQLTRTVYQTGDIQPLCEFIETRYFKAFDNRDYRWANELTIKTAFLTLLFDDIFYMIDSETSLERSYADLTLILRPDMRKYQLLDILLEFKYVSLKELGLSGAEVKQAGRDELKALAPVKQKLAESQAKLAGYRQILTVNYGDALRLYSYSVVGVGFERLVWAGGK